MSDTTTKPATVRRSLLVRKSMAAGLTTLGATCTTGAQCPQVKGNPIASQALAALQQSVTAAEGSLTSKEEAAQALTLARKALTANFKQVRVALGTYETAVAAIAAGSASIITAAGLLARDQKPVPATLTAVSVVHTKLGKRAGEAILSWPVAPGATSYAIEVCFTPTASPLVWVAIASGKSRRRTVKAPAPGAQFQARVAAVASDGTQSDWSNPVTATAR